MALPYVLGAPNNERGGIACMTVLGAQTQWAQLDAYLTWCNECFRAWTALVSLWRGRLWPGSQDNDATSLYEAGPHRNAHVKGRLDSLNLPRIEVSPVYYL